MDILALDNQVIHAMVQVRPSSCPQLLSGIYAPPNRTVRRLLWNNL